LDYRAQLAKQLGFLWRSCAAYDQGHIDEAVRIATAIRVLVHNTKNSTSLLNHLDALGISLASTVSTMDRSRSVFMFGMGQGIGTDKGMTWAANTDCKAIDRQLPIAEWWEQVVYIRGQLQATRRNLVLAAANKDGGAHVDSALTKEYEALMTTGESGWFHYPGEDGTFRPIMDSHLMYIRQMGFELLNSPQLLDLASP
jgi:hypothetical protein